MKVLHLIPGLANSSGPTQALVQLTTHLEDQGADISVAYLSNRLPDQSPPNLKRGRIYPFRVVGLRHWGYSPELRRFLHQNLASFDVLHIHALWLYHDWIGSRSAKRQQVPYIIRPAGSLEPVALTHKSAVKQAYFQLIEKQVINGAARIHAVSEKEAQTIRAQNYRPSCCVIPNGIDAQSFTETPTRNEARAALGIAPEDPTLLYLGRLHPIKGLEFLAPVIKSLTESFPRLRLLVAGPNNTPYATSLQNHYQQAGILPHTQFLGELKASQKLQAYRAADLFLLPSHSENFGMVVAEALAAGTPAVVSDQTPWLALNDRKAGACIPLEMRAWIDTIAQYLNSPEAMKHAGTAGRQLIETEYAWPNIARRMLDTYENVVAEATPT